MWRRRNNENVTRSCEALILDSQLTLSIPNADTPNDLGTSSFNRRDGRIMVLLVLLGLASTWLWPRVARSPVVQFTLASCTILGFGVFFALIRKPLTLHFKLRRPHWVQILTQGSIFAYWAFYVPEVVDQLPLIGAQIVLGYTLDGILNWRRRGVWELGCGPVPVIGSINLFLWSHDGFWFLQALMVTIAFLGREWIRWHRHGRSVHIFNPSGLALFIVAVGVLTVDRTDVVWGEFISTTLNIPPHMYLVIFAAGLVAQILFDTTLVTTMAAVTVWILVELYAWSTGQFFFIDTHIPIAVFLGMNLLITDPATSPRSITGRALFGASYGFMVLPLWTGLNAIGQPAYFDKLLQVPLLNLCVPLFERLGNAMESVVKDRSWTRVNGVHVGIWCLCFACLYPNLIDHPGDRPAHWQSACESGKDKACNNLRHVLASHCGQRRAQACAALAERLSDVRSLYFAPREAAELRKRACALGQLQSCEANRKVQTTRLDVSPEDLFQIRAACGLNARSCTQLGNLILSLKPHPNWGQDAYEAFKRACDAEDLDACANMALMKLRGDGVQKDRDKALEINEATCTLGLALGCARAATMLMERVGQSTRKDESRALGLMKKACTLGDFGACVTKDRWQMQSR